MTTMLTLDQRRLARAARKAADPLEQSLGAPAAPKDALAFYEARAAQDPYALSGVGRVVRPFVRGY